MAGARASANQPSLSSDSSTPKTKPVPTTGALISLNQAFHTQKNSLYSEFDFGFQPISSLSLLSHTQKRISVSILIGIPISSGRRRCKFIWVRGRWLSQAREGEGTGSWRGDGQVLPSTTQGATVVTSTVATDNSLSDMYRSPPRPLPYDVDPQYFRLQRDGLVSRREKGSSHSHEETEPLRRIDIDAVIESLTIAEKWNTTGEDGSKEIRKSSVKLSSRKSAAEFAYVYSSSEDEDVCPTCLEEYTRENPKIMTKCSHTFHLGCIYEWMERSENCPVCGKLMAIEETP
ncbi:E3 ubiquitin-protein ligase-like protein [Drosera capensis]